MSSVPNNSTIGFTQEETAPRSNSNRLPGLTKELLLVLTEQEQPPYVTLEDLGSEESRLQTAWSMGRHDLVKELVTRFLRENEGL